MSKDSRDRCGWREDERCELLDGVDRDFLQATVIGGSAAVAIVLVVVAVVLVVDWALGPWGDLALIIAAFGPGYAYGKFEDRIWAPLLRRIDERQRKEDGR